MFFLSVQQVILIASDQSAEETIVLPLPSPPYRTDYLSFIFQSNCFNHRGGKYYKKHEGKHSKVILLSFLHVFNPVIKLRHGTVTCSGPYGAGIPVWKSILKDVRKTSQTHFYENSFFS